MFVALIEHHNREWIAIFWIMLSAKILLSVSLV